MNYQTRITPVPTMILMNRVQQLLFKKKKKKKIARQVFIRYSVISASIWLK